MKRMGQMKPVGSVILGAALVRFAQAAAQRQSAESVERPVRGSVQPAISPDGKSVAFSYQGIICRLPSEGGALTRLTEGEGWDVEPAWSPDGKRIAFINAPGFNAGPLRLITAEDGSLVKLPKDVLARGRLQYHPDGKRLLGMFALTGQPDRLQWFDLNSGELTPVSIALIEAHQRSSMKWALSPNGTTILLATFQDRPGEQTGNNGPSTGLWGVPSAGGEPQKVTRWPSRIYGLCWDAEGRGVFAVTDRGVAYNDLWHIPLDRNAWLASPPKNAELHTEASAPQARKITFGQADEDWPSVSAD